MTPDFLSLEDALDIHARQLNRFGGAAGLRDRGLLESALAQPQTSFSGQYLHADLYEMSAAYLFHIVSNHPFVDGNKRAGLLCALVFLRLNGVEILDSGESLYRLTYDTAAGLLDKPKIADHLRRLAAPDN